MTPQHTIRAVVVAIVQQEIDFHDWDELRDVYPELEHVTREELEAFLAVFATQE
jgi:hypothetical protein